MTASRSGPGSPALSVLMPVYNGEAHLRDAIDSILTQTFSDFEFIIVDDHSTDSTRDIVKNCGDPRIRCLENAGDKGISPSLNVGLRAARGAFIARMDADDLCLPQRFEKQVRFMDAHPEVGICGTFQEFFGGYCDGPNATAVSHEQIKAALLFGPTMLHSTVMMRAHVLRENGLVYSERHPYCEDYDLWARAARVTRLANIPEFLCRYRWEEGKTWETDAEALMGGLRDIWAGLLGEVGLDPTPEALERHAIAVARGPVPGRKGVIAVKRHLDRIIALNRDSKVFDEGLLLQGVHKAWRTVCWRSRKKSPSVLLSHAATRLFPPAFWIL